MVILFFLLISGFNHCVMNIEYSVFKDKGYHQMHIRDCTKQAHQFISKIFIICYQI